MLLIASNDNIQILFVLFVCSTIVSQPYHWARDQGTWLQGVGPREGPGNARECENELSHSQVNPMLGLGVPVDSRNFRERLQRENPLSLWNSLYHWKATKT
jgi:hypothetical protein